MSFCQFGAANAHRLQLACRSDELAALIGTVTPQQQLLRLVQKEVLWMAAGPSAALPAASPGAAAPVAAAPGGPSGGRSGAGAAGPLLSDPELHWRIAPHDELEQAEQLDGRTQEASGGRQVPGIGKIICNELFVICTYKYNKNRKQNGYLSPWQSGRLFAVLSRS